MLIGAAVVASMLVSADPADAQDDLDTQQEKVRQREADVAVQIDATRATDQELSDALSVLAGQVGAQRYSSEDAERAVTAAQDELAEVRAQQAAAQAEVDTARAQLREAALTSYMSPLADGQLAVLFGSGPADAAVHDALSRTAVVSMSDAIDQLRAAQGRLTGIEKRAVQATQAAEAADEEARRRLSKLNVAYDQQSAVVEDVATRLDALLSESAGLSAQHADVAAQIDARQAALAAQAMEVQQAANAAREEATTTRTGWVDPTPPAAPAVSATRTGYNVPLATVAGIEVHANIAAQLGAMIAAAAVDGITLTGGGWRSPDEQIQIRMEVCGTSDYAIWEMPSWECSPPVARPGRSMHEQGLAIDFTAGGDLIRSRSHPAFAWLAANAERYGFYNLPSEPWHWSTTGS